VGALPNGFTDTFVANVESPTALAFTPEGRLLVTTQFGEVRVIDGGTLLAQPALDLGGVICTADEMGLLGVAVDPAFAGNGFVYLYYTRSKAGSCVNRVSRFTMSGATIGSASELVLVDEIPATGNHNAGDLRFGNDGFLYVSVGDGGCDYADDSGCAGQNDASRDQHVLVGKILRITASGGIPASNPFQGAGTARCNVTGTTTAGNKCQETFAWGLRNPFRFAFDPNTSGTRFYINDVGQGVWEEIDLGQAGADYGWNVREGPCANGSQTNCGPPPAGMTNPIYAYSHAQSGCAAITGGAFVPNGAWPASYDGAYLFGDYTCGKIFQLVSDGSGGFTRTEFATDLGAVVNMTFGPSAGGQALYYTNYSNGGEVRRIEPTVVTNRAPTATMTATPRSGDLPLDVSFDGSTSSDPDAGDTLTYVWSFGDGSQAVTTTAPTTSHTYTAAGTFTATLIVRDNRGAESSPASVRIDPGNRPPQVTIDSPTASARFAVGETITLRATATDPEDGALPPSRLSWRVLRHHDTHTHPFLAPTPGNGLTIQQPAPEDLGSGVDGYLELQLTATDSAGVTTMVTRDVLPRKVSLTFATDPAGRQVVVAGAAYTGPTTLVSWEGHTIAVDAPSQTDGSGNSWVFQAWSDGGAAAHSFATPAAPTTYTATFVRSTAPPGLVAAYGLNGSSGSAVVDSSGRGNSGTVSGASWSSAGRFGSALSFDGVNDWVTVADAASLDLSSGMTLEAWVRPSRLGGWRTVVFKERSGGVVYGLYGDQAGGRPLGQVDIGGERNAVGSASLPLDAWSHLATTFDGSMVRLYVNGTQAGVLPFSGSMAASTGPLRLGGNSVWGEWFAGLIDEVRVYNRALSASEIQQDLQTPVGESSPPADTTPPSAPSGLTSSAAPGSVTLSWTAATDTVGVVRYNVHRSGTAGFTPSTTNRVGQPTGTSYTESGLAAGTYYFRVTAEDAAGNVSDPSAELSAVVPPEQPPPPTGLVAAFALNAGSGSNVADSSGSKNSGTVSGATWSSSGRFGSALSFDGVNDWVTVADAASLDLSSGMTLEAWVRPSRLGGWRTVVFKERSGGVVYGLYGDQAGGRPLGQVDIGGERNAVGSASLPLNVWSHLATTFDGSMVRLYVNGTQAGSLPFAGSMAASTGPLRLGGNSVWGEWFAGLIDEVRVYNRALSASEIQQDLQTPVG
jgi:glucose/arabinose dehydrogenase/PKD repeat protein